MAWWKKASVVTVGHPILRQNAVKIVPRMIQSVEIKNILEIMAAKVKNGDCFGIAAPQLGKSYTADKNKK